jgi:spore maturation protein CgeB
MPPLPKMKSFPLSSSLPWCTIISQKLCAQTNLFFPFNSSFIGNSVPVKRKVTNSGGNNCRYYHCKREQEISLEISLLGKNNEKQK